MSTTTTPPTTSPCARCGRPFTYDAARVPMIPIDGVGHPVCRPCLDAINVERAAIRLDPLVGTYPD